MPTSTTGVELQAPALDTARNILTISRKWEPLTHVPPMVELAVTWQESTWYPGAINADDPGGSYGPWQINGLAHPDDAQVARSEWYDYGYRAVWEAHRAAWTEALQERWAEPANRPGVIEEFAPAAQGSVAWTAEQAASAYSMALAALELLS